MAISSLSKVYDAPDPILETDLELLGKVNTYEQAQFDAGQQAVQDEISKWAMLSDVAKPQDRQYINTKLNNLVNGINNLGGVNLRDPSNVNSLKALGYNLYGDQAVTNAVATTGKLRNFMNDAKSKFSGKNAGLYDPIHYEYQLSKWNNWLNDGQVGTSFNGPTDLPVGNMNSINKKVSDYLKTVKPDADKFPTGVSPESLGYFKFENKWLSRDRVREAINATTDENDQNIFRAHGWKALTPYTNEELLGLQGKTYDYTNSQLQSDIDKFNTELSQTKDTLRKQELQTLIKTKQDALINNTREKNAFMSKKNLTSDERESLQQAIYFKGWQDNVINSQAYSQQSKEYALNPVTSFKTREERQAQQFAASYNLNVDKFKWDMQVDAAKLDIERLKAQGDQNNPLGLTNAVRIQAPNTQAGVNELKNPDVLIDNFKSNYYATHGAYYQNLYNIIGEKDGGSRFDFNPQTNTYSPKPEFKDQIDKELDVLDNKISNYGNLTDEERKSLNLPVDEQELNDIFKLKKANSISTAYYNMSKQKENEIFNHAFTTGNLKTDFRDSKVDIGGKDVNGKHVPRIVTIEEALATYNGLDDKGKNALDNVELVNVAGETRSWWGGQTGARPSSMKANSGKISNFINNADPNYTFKDLREEVKDIKNNMRQDYEKAGGTLFNSYDVIIPFSKLKPYAQEEMKKELVNTKELEGKDFKSITPISGKVQIDGTTGKTLFNLKVQVGSGAKAKTEEIDVTSLVANSENSTIAKLFPSSDQSLIFGMYLSNDGATPLSKADNYKSALKTTFGNYPYQVIKSGQKGGSEFYKVKLLYPEGNGKYIDVDVKNLYDNDSYRFDPTIDGISDYLDQIFSNPEATKLFKAKHNLK